MEKVSKRLKVADSEGGRPLPIDWEKIPASPVDLLLENNMLEDAGRKLWYDAREEDAVDPKKMRRDAVLCWAASHEGGIYETEESWPDVVESFLGEQEKAGLIDSNEKKDLEEYFHDLLEKPSHLKMEGELLLVRRGKLEFDLPAAKDGLKIRGKVA
ncbi:MAG: hypothetical protein ABH851_00530 [Methanobacteriota archaeon]